jgi:hypothetical protein
LEFGFWCLRFVLKVFAYAAQDRADPEYRGFLIIDPKEYRLGAGGRDEFAQLGACELEKRRRVG